MVVAPVANQAGGLLSDTPRLRETSRFSFVAMHTVNWSASCTIKLDLFAGGPARLKSGVAITTKPAQIRIAGSTENSTI
jgi:hypothetical protein